MVRTSITLPEHLHQRLLLSAKAEGKNMVQMIKDLIDDALVRKEKANITKSYDALDQLVGICKDNVADASSTINETLYGEGSIKNVEVEK